MDDIKKPTLPNRSDFKNMGVGGSVVAALIFLTPVKQWFYTREEGTALSKSVDEIKATIVAESKENTRLMERKTDKIMEMFRESEARNQRNIDHDNLIQNDRLQTLEAAILRSKKSTN